MSVEFYSSFIPDIDHLYFLFFLNQSGQVFLTFDDHFKEPTLGFIFFIVHLCSSSLTCVAHYFLIIIYIGFNMLNFFLVSYVENLDLGALWSNSFIETLHILFNSLI